jgi:hypothetical protein
MSAHKSTVHKIALLARKKQAIRFFRFSRGVNDPDMRALNIDWEQDTDFQANEISKIT